MGKRNNLAHVSSGSRFGRLTVICEYRSDSMYSKKRRAWLAKCDCGCESIVLDYSLKAGKTSSCGCVVSETTKLRMTKHGHATRGERTKEWNTWNSMIGRCFRENSHGYKDYGGRGITVCERWVGDSGFSNFLSDMGNCPSKSHSIERVDFNGNYEPSNCVWIPRSDQSKNTRRTHFIVFRGEKMCLADFARATGIAVKTLFYRLKKGMTPEEACIPRQ